MKNLQVVPSDMNLAAAEIELIGVEEKEYILKETERIKKEGLCKDAFLRIKKNMYGKYIKSFNNIESIGNSYSANYFLGIELFDFLDVYDEITYEDAQERFNELFVDDMFVTSIVSPK